MDIRILTLLVLIGIVGSFAEPEARERRYGPQEYGTGSIMDLIGAPRLKRAVGDPNGAGNYAWTSTQHGPGGGSSAVASASSSSGGFSGGYPAVEPTFVGTRGGFVDNTPYYASPYGDNQIAPFFGPSSFAFPTVDFDPFGIQARMDDHFKQLQKQFELQQQSFLDTTMNNVPTGGSGGPQIAMSSISLGPGGGHHSGLISPGTPGIQSRFAEELPPSSGGSVGVFSSASSSSVVGPDGKQVSRKSATTGVNDNGKITFRTVHD